MGLTPRPNRWVRFEQDNRPVWLKCVVCGRRLTAEATMALGYEQRCAQHFTPDFLEARKRGIHRMEQLRLEEVNKLGLGSRVAKYRHDRNSDL